jgi:hypothetical protein
MITTLKCARCGTANRGTQYFCSQCGLNLHAPGGSTVQEVSEPSAAVSSQTAVVPSSNQLVQKSSSEEMISDIATLPNRYKDAYIAGRLIEGLGTIVKAVGIVGGVMLFLIGILFFWGFFGTFSLIIGSVAGAVIGGITYLLGVLVSAQGQVLRATLDTAVNTSPLLTESQKARLLGA